jgi:Tfp pilus assembly protein PilN
MELDFSSLEMLLGYGAGCISGYGFAIRVLMPSMIAAKVAPLEVKIQELEKQQKSLSERLEKEHRFSNQLQAKLLELDEDDRGLKE